MSLQSHARIEVALNGTSIGVWDKKSGGGVDSSETTYRSGGMAPRESLGGSTEPENVTLQRLYRLSRDHALLPTLLANAGKGRVVVTDQPLDPFGNRYGRPIVHTGTLKKVTPPDRDSESDDPAMIEIEITPDDVPTA